MTTRVGRSCRRTGLIAIAGQPGWRGGWFLAPSGRHALRNWPGGRRESALRPAFTLFEMVLVIVVLVAVAALTWPSLSRIYGHYQLQQSAQVAQVRLMAARIHALETGTPYQFRFEPGGRRFIMLPDDLPPANAGATSGGTSSTAATAATSGTSTGPMIAVPKIAGVLPSESSRFEGANMNSAVPGANVVGGSQLPEAWLQGLPDIDKLRPVMWSPPIVFYPDGSSQAAEFMVRDKHDRGIRIIIRALTGGVTLGKPE